MFTSLKIIAEKFQKAGYELFEVGGCVRDSLLGKESNDIDLTTDATPEMVQKLLQDIPGSVYNIGQEYGTIGIISDFTKVEITTYRDEVYPTDNRKPLVIFGKTLSKDLARRDFTINALARNPLTGEIIDLFGGLNDLKQRKIKLVGGTDRFSEDPLRMLRAIRFSVQLNFSLEIEIPNPERIKIIRSMAPGVG